MFENLNLLLHIKRRRKPKKISRAELRAFVKSVRYQLFSRRQGLTYFKFLLRVLKRYPHMFAKAVRLAIQGYHFEKVTSQETAVDDFNKTLETEFDTFKQTTSQFVKTQGQRIGEVRDSMQKLLNQAYTQYETIHQDFRCNLNHLLNAFRYLVENYVEVEWNSSSSR